MAAQWAAWVVSLGRAVMSGEASDVFEPADLPEERTPERLTKMWATVERHADEALQIAGITIDEGSRQILLGSMLRPVQAVYLQADLEGLGVGGINRAVNPLAVALEALPRAGPRERCLPTNRRS